MTPDGQTATALDARHAQSDRPPYGILAVLMIGAFITFLNNTLLNIALPSIMTDLSVGPATVQWLTTGFMLVNGILIPATAFLIQKYSVRRLFLAAIGLFTIGTVIGGMAHTFPLLLTSRMVQASGAAIMMPLLMNVMLVSFPVEKRGTAMGIFGLILMFAPAIGPTLSGWIVEHYDWRMLFHFVTPIAGVILIIGFFMLKDRKAHVDIRLDLFSLLLSSVGFGGLLYGFSAAGQEGWGSPIVAGTIAAGTAALIWFIMRQAGKEQPMLNFGVFRYSMFALSSVISMVLNIAMFSGILLLPIYVQTIRGISPFDAGLMLLPGALLNAALSPITGRLFDKFGAKMLAVVGLLDVMVTTYLFSRLTLTTGYYELMILNAVRMVGISMVMMPVSTNGLNQLPRKLYPHGTAMNNTLNQVSAALGTAAMVTIMSMRQETYAEELAAENGITGAPLPDALTAVAMMEGINDAFLVSSFVAGLAVLLALFIRRGSELKVRE